MRRAEMTQSLNSSKINALMGMSPGDPAPRACASLGSLKEDKVDDGHLTMRGVVSGSGHKTTVKLEPAFWDMLSEICRREKLTLDGLVREVDEMRGQSPRASALRVYALKYFVASVMIGEMSSAMTGCLINANNGPEGRFS